MSSWAGIPLEDRAAERRSRLLAAALTLAEAGDDAVTVRATIREAGLNPRYFYESFASVDELLGAMFDQQAEALQARLAEALTGDDPAVVLRAGVETVLRFLTEDPRRARVLVSGWATSPELIARRRLGVEALSDLVGASLRGVAVEPFVSDVYATMFAGAMGALAEAWAAGRLGPDLAPVVDRAVEMAIAMATAVAP